MMKKCECSQCKNRLCATKVPIFDKLDNNELLQISSKIDYKEYKKNDIIFSEGTPADTFYFINEGKVKIYKHDKQGKEQIFQILSSGEFLGQINLIKTSKYNFYAKVIEDTKICTLNKMEMKEIIMRNPEIAVKLLENIGDRLLSLENMVQNLSINNIDSRMAYLLIELARRNSIETSEGIEVNLDMTRENMASFIGVTRETISRKLKKLQQQSIIKIKGTKKIIILDKEKLHSLNEVWSVK